jgi:carbon-monoxide dehydrogenase medium subunit
MDLPPVLAALGARVAISGPNGGRELPLVALYSGYYETVLEKNELITSATVPALDGRKAAYMKVTLRTADDWPALGVAVSFAVKEGALHDPTVVVSAATEKVTRITGAEKVLQGATPDDTALTRAGEAAAAEAVVLADAHGSAAYKRELLRVYLRRAVRQALSEQALAESAH